MSRIEEGGRAHTRPTIGTQTDSTLNSFSVTSNDGVSEGGGWQETYWRPYQSPAPQPMVLQQGRLLIQVEANTCGHSQEGYKSSSIEDNEERSAEESLETRAMHGMESGIDSDMVFDIREVTFGQELERKDCSFF